MQQDVSSLPVVTLTNGSQTIAKGILTAYLFSYSPLASLSFILSKVISILFPFVGFHDFNWSIIFSDKSIT